MARGTGVMYYIYYTETGEISTVTNALENSVDPNYIEVDLQTYEEFSNGTKHLFNYIVVKNTKIVGKMHVVPRNIPKNEDQAQLKGIISKENATDNSIVLHQHIATGIWSATHTLSDINCAMFAHGNDHIKEYYVVDSTNRYILLDTLQVNLKTLASSGAITISNYKKDICKKSVSLLCSSHHVKHIHIVED